MDWLTALGKKVHRCIHAPPTFPPPKIDSERGERSLARLSPLLKQ